MPRVQISLAVAVLLAITACSSSTEGNNKSKGPAVAKGEGISIGADEFKSRLDEQSPFIRQRYSTLEGKKEFLDNLLRLELLANEARRQGLEKDPEVQQALKRMMVQRLVQKTFTDGADAAKEIPEADQKKYYEDHKGDFVKPKKVRLHQIFLAAASGTPDRATKAKQAKELLAKLKAEEKNPTIFASLARERSEDQATKNVGGDLGFKSEEELGKAYGEPFAKAAFGSKDNDLLTLESAQGLHVVKVSGRQEAFERTFDQAKTQIASRLLQEKRRKDFDEFVKKLREKAHITVDDGALEKVAVAASQPPPGGGMTPMNMSATPPPNGHPPQAPQSPAPPQATPAPHPTAPAPPPSNK